MVEEPSKVLSTLLSAAAILSGSEPKTQSLDLATILASRLARAHELLQKDQDDNISGRSLQAVQYMTARESLHLLEKMQSVLDHDDNPPSGSGSSPPLLGTRDLSYIRTLLSVIFKWGVIPLMLELELNLPGHQAHGSPISGEPRIIDLTERLLDFEDLPVITLRILRLLFGPTKVRQTWITTSILSQHAADLLAPCLVVGWAPRQVYDVSVSISQYSKDVMSFAIRFLNVYVLYCHHLGRTKKDVSVYVPMRQSPLSERYCLRHPPILNYAAFLTFLEHVSIC